MWMNGPNYIPSVLQQLSHWFNYEGSMLLIHLRKYFENLNL